VDQLARDYAGQPVVFIEYDVDYPPASRYTRWWAAFSGSSAYLPLVMVDSGQQISNGHQTFYDVYAAMVNTAWMRPPEAELEAYWWLEGSRAQFYVRMKNLSPVALSMANTATLHGIVYEESRVKVTGRFARAAVETGIPDLAPGETAVFQFGTSDLGQVNYDRLHVVVLADYRPRGPSEAFDMLQAAVAERLSAGFSAAPDRLAFAVEPSQPSIAPIAVSLEGPDFMTWTATSSAYWLTVTPSEGAMVAQPSITVNRDDLSPGWQQGQVTFTTADGLFSDEVWITVYLGAVERVYLPLAVLSTPPEGAQ
jgi:hypothetical protein